MNVNRFGRERKNITFKEKYLMSKKGPYTKNLFESISEGLLGYIMYLSRTGMHEAYSEYLLYDPIIRIAKDKNWIIKSEFPVDPKKTKGDKLRIDFLFKSENNPLNVVGLEVKYLKTDEQIPDLENDCTKLESLNKYVEHESLKGFILIAGRLSEDKANDIHVYNDKYIKSEHIYSSCYFSNQYHTNYGVAVFEVV